MARYRISCEIDLPDGIGEDDIYAWARYQLGENSEIATANPLIDKPIDALFLSVEVDRLRP